MTGYYLRFTEREENANTTSLDWKTNEVVSGVYGYDVTDEFEAMLKEEYELPYIAEQLAKNLARKNSYCENENGHFIIFYGVDKGCVEEQTACDGVPVHLAKIKNIEFKGQMFVHELFGWTLKYTK